MLYAGRDDARRMAELDPTQRTVSGVTTALGSAAPPDFLAYIDESGTPGTPSNGEEHYVTTAVVLPAARVGEALRRWQQFQCALHEPERGTPISRVPLTHFTKLDDPNRMWAVNQLASLKGSSIISVAVSRPAARFGNIALGSQGPGSYFETLQYLLERLSWFGRQNHGTVAPVVGQWGETGLAQLRAAEERIRQTSASMEWRWIWEQRCVIRTTRDEPLLQLADTAASATRAAFETGKDNRVSAGDPNYLFRLRPRLWRVPRRCEEEGLCDRSCLSSYGLKLVQMNDSAAWRYGYLYSQLGPCHGRRPSADPPRIELGRPPRPS